MRFHRLLDQWEVQGPRAHAVPVALHRALEALHGFPERIDGISGYWDFPVTQLVPLLCREFGLPGPSFESVLRCEHKYWSRISARAAVPEHLPRFRAIDPFDDADVDGIDLTFPYWIKPIKSTDSELAFRIREPRDLERCLPLIRERIHRFSDPFAYLLRFAHLPDEVKRVDGQHCLVEEELSGSQCTVEGYVHGGRARVHGIIDSIRYPGVPSFFRYQYPSRLPARIQRRLARISRRIVEAVGLDRSTWNVEFFVDPRTGRVSILEVNPRVSQSHSHMFDLVDGASNLEIAVDLALGREPAFPSSRGPFRCASKFFVRVFHGGTITRAPTEEEVRTIEERFPGTLVHIKVDQGTRLSELWGQDSYSFRVAEIHMGANSTRELMRKFAACREMLRFEFAPEETELPSIVEEDPGRVGVSGLGVVGPRPELALPAPPGSPSHAATFPAHSGSVSPMSSESVPLPAATTMYCLPPAA